MNNVSTYCVGNLATKVNEWSKITSDPWILQTVQAYRLEFKTKPTQISPPKQHTRSKDEYDLIQLEIDNLLKKRAISETEHSADEFLSNIFLVPN